MFYLSLISRILSFCGNKLVRCFCSYLCLILCRPGPFVHLAHLRILSEFTQPVFSWWWKIPRGCRGKFKESLGIQLEGVVLTENAQEKGLSGRGGSQADRQGDEGLWKHEQHSKNISEKNKQATGCQAVAQQRYFPLCAQLDLWDGEQYSPLLSQTLTQAGEFSFSVIGLFRNSTAWW